MDGSVTGCSLLLVARCAPELQSTQSIVVDYPSDGLQSAWMYWLYRRMRYTEVRRESAVMTGLSSEWRIDSRSTQGTSVTIHPCLYQLAHCTAYIGDIPLHSG